MVVKTYKKPSTKSYKKKETKSYYKKKPSTESYTKKVVKTYKKPSTKSYKKKSTYASECEWEGHCLHAKCSSWNDCFGELTCTDGKCAEPSYTKKPYSKYYEPSTQTTAYGATETEVPIYEAANSTEYLDTSASGSMSGENSASASRYVIARLIQF
jgi:hypothetical protein